MSWGYNQDEKESVGGGGNKFPPAPRGIYTIQVAEPKAGVTKEAQLPKVDLMCEIADEGSEFGKRVYLTVTNFPPGHKSRGLFVHSCHAFGIEPGKQFDDPEQEFQGRTARALLGIETRTKVKDGRTYENEVNFVEVLYSPNHPEPEDGQLPPEKKAAAAAAAKPAGGAKPSAAAQKVFGGGKQPAAAGAGKKDVPF